MERIENNRQVNGEVVTDERIRQVVGGALEAIVCDSSVNALVLSAERVDTQNGLRVGIAFNEEIKALGGASQLVTFQPRTWDEPRDESITELLQQQVINLVIVPDMDTLGHDGFAREKPYVLGDQKYTEALYYRKAKKDIRAFWFMVNDLSRFLDSVDIDYEELGNLSRRLDQEFQKVRSIEFHSGNGAVLEFDTKEGNLPNANYNFEQNKLGEGGNLPFGEVLISPNNKTGDGAIVFDGSFYGDDTVSIKDPLTLRFEGGKVIKIEGGSEAEQLSEYLKGQARRTEEAMGANAEITADYLDNIYRIGEFAIGVNPKAVFCGDLLIDEKVYGSAHIAIGRSYHGDPAFSHVDLVVRKPKIVFRYFDESEKVVVENGEVLL